MKGETAESLPPLPLSLPPYLREGLISIDSEETIDVDGGGNGRDAAVVEEREAGREAGREEKREERREGRYL